MSQNIATFHGAAAMAVRFDISASEHKGHTFVTTDPRGFGKVRFYGTQGKPAGSHFNTVENASDVYGAPRVVFSMSSGETYAIAMPDEHYGISAADFIAHCLDKKTGDLLNVKRLSDQEIQIYNIHRNHLSSAQAPSQEQIAHDRLDVDYRQTGHTFTKTDQRGYGKIRLYGHDGKLPGHSFRSVSNASLLYGGVPRFVVQFQSGEFYRVSVKDPEMDVNAFVKEFANGPDLRAKRMSAPEVTQYLLAKNFHEMHGRPAGQDEMRAVITGHHQMTAAEARR